MKKKYILNPYFNSNTTMEQMNIKKNRKVYSRRNYKIYGIEYKKEGT